MSISNLKHNVPGLPKRVHRKSCSVSANTELEVEPSRATLVSLLTFKVLYVILHAFILD